MIAIKGSKGYVVALESIAMTDIVLNLFIFFFISFSLLYTLQPDRMTRIEVRLPKASSSVIGPSLAALRRSLTNSTTRGASAFRLPPPWASVPVFARWRISAWLTPNGRTCGSAASSSAENGGSSGPRLNSSAISLQSVQARSRHGMSQGAIPKAPR